MDAFNPIGDVGRTLRALLLDGMGTWSVDDEQIALASPEQFEPEEVGLSLHLYHLEKHAHRAQQSGSAPVTLDLYYLLTAHPPNGETVDTSDTLEQHRMLSKAVQTLRTHSSISGSNLQGSLAGGESLQVTIDTGATDHVMDVWTSFQDTPYMPSISYIVSPVTIDTPDAEAAPPVTEVTTGYHDDGATGGTR